MAAELCSRSSYASTSLAVQAWSTKAPRQAQARSVSRRRAAGWFSAGLAWLAATLARPRRAGADADAPDEEAENMFLVADKAWAVVVQNQQHPIALSPN